MAKMAHVKNVKNKLKAHITSWVPLGCLFGASWGRLGGLVGASWAPLGGLLAPLGGPLGPLGPLLGASWKPLGCILALPREQAEISYLKIRLRCGVKPSWGRLGTLLGPSWAVLRRSWGHLGTILSPS